MLIGGYITSVNGVSRHMIARLNADGSTDPSFGNGVNGPDYGVYCMAMQPDGKVLIGGNFGLVNGVRRVGVARLNEDGSLDTGFLNGLSGADSDVMSVAVQADGKVLIGGFFTSVSGVNRSYIAQLNADGSLDTGFLNGLSGPDDCVYSVAVQADRKILMGGWFRLVNGLGRSSIARLNADGSLDTGFLNGLSGTDYWVSSVAVQANGKILIGGGFTTVNGISRNRMARLNANGSLDTGFLNGLSGVTGYEIDSVAVQPDGKVLIGGDFGQLNGVGRERIARLNSDGSLDTGFDNGLGVIGDNWPNDPCYALVYSVAMQPDGKILMGGTLSRVHGVTQNGIARLNADGSADEGFLRGLDGVSGGIVHSVAVQADGKILVGGGFASVNGASCYLVARLNADGSTDRAFHSGLRGGAQ